MVQLASRGARQLCPLVSRVIEMQLGRDGGRRELLSKGATIFTICRALSSRQRASVDVISCHELMRRSRHILILTAPTHFLHIATVVGHNCRHSVRSVKL